VPHEQEALGRPGVSLVGAWLLRLEILDVLAHVLGLRPNAEQLPQERELLAGMPEIALQIGQRAQATHVFRRE
jgi:hypothetical protein